MPSPFPGMDPYLEGSEWRSVHTQLSVEIARYLVPRVQPKYFIRTEKNYILAASDSELDRPLSRRSPDVSVIQATDQNVTRTGSVAVLEPPMHLEVAIPEEEPEVTVEIFDVARKSLVTAIEVLPLTNKIRSGRAQYLAKRNKLLRSTAHLLEIDLLRLGERAPMKSPLPVADYFVVLSPADRRPVADVWPIALRLPLPTVPVPLLAGDADVSLDLQVVLTGMYDAFRYDLELDYKKPPEVPLGTDDANWAATLLCER
jgi:hypothetical protein